VETEKNTGTIAFRFRQVLLYMVFYIRTNLFFSREESVALTRKEAVPLLRRLVAGLSPRISGFWVNLCGYSGIATGFFLRLS